MKNPSKLFIVTTMLLLLFSASSAQDNTCQVILYSGDTLTACRLDSLHDNVLSATCDIRAFSFPVDSIAVLVQHKEGHFWKGAAIGSFLGAGAGAIVGYATYHKPANGWTFDLGPGGSTGGGLIIGAVGGFVVGGVFGASSTVTKTYNLKGKTLRVKLQIIEYLLHN